MRKVKRLYVPDNVRSIVRYVCADYDRRRMLIAAGNAGVDIITEAMRLNDAVDDALSNVDPGLRCLRVDIACGRGYEHSAAACICAKNTYYAYKKKVMYEIAHSLALV
jgi:hypothetical protein